MVSWRRRSGVLLTLALALMPLFGAQPNNKKPLDQNEYFQGSVVPLADLLARQKVKIDADGGWLVLKGDDGKIYPLVKDDGSRMFFKDAKLLNRPMRLTARRIPNSPFLQVITVQSIVKGKLHDVYYWCDVCTIMRYEAGICDCCGAPMEFRETPVK